ncbi:hypothetical protein BRW65_02710 [Mycobacterium paraffinicum]|uniref:Uncharacterized protein n=1 Tax=Mycobacterium paraffinicum TaxID=53378 RepID=A0A1Q4I0P1_9MYCO|nr:hypothetical protein BRW65_02710 [Mycobacterium paraffinicum]
MLHESVSPPTEFAEQANATAVLYARAEAGTGWRFGPSRGGCCGTWSRSRELGDTSTLVDPGVFEAIRVSRSEQ